MKDFSELNVLKYFKNNFLLKFCLHNGEQPLLKLPQKGTHHGEMKKKLDCCPETQESRQLLTLHAWSLNILKKGM